MHAHRSCRTGWGETLLFALLLPAIMALAAPARAQSFPVSAPSVTGNWATQYSALAVGGFYYVAFNQQNAPASEAIWSVTLPQPGQYQLYVSSVPTVDVPRTANARYEVSTSLGIQLVSGVNQDFAGEQLLGTFVMNGGPNTLRLTDLTGEPQGSHTVVANSARWVLLPSGPPPPPGAPVITGYLDFYGNPITAAPPGTPVQIVGNNFGLSGSVTIAGLKATIVRWSPTDVRVLTPLTGNPGAVTGPVVVTTGGQTATGPDFSIDPNAPQPTPGPPVPPVPTPIPTPIPQPPGPVVTGYAATNPAGAPISSAPPGAPVLILGSNLGSSGAVSFNGLPAPVASWSPTQILVNVPAASYYPYSGPVTVTTNGQTATGPVFTITAPAVTADWAMFMHDPRQTGLADLALDPRTLRAWSVNLGGRPGTSPVVVGGTAYMGTDAGVFAIDTASRTIRWSRVLSAPVGSAPAATAQVVVVSAGGLYGLSPVDGSILWQRPDIVADSDVSPILVDGTIYIGARGPTGVGSAMYAVSAVTGAPVWAAPAALSSTLDARSTAAVFQVAGELYVGLGPPPGASEPGAGPSAVVALRLTDGSAAWSGPAMFPTSPPPTGLTVGYTGSGAQPGPGGVLPALIQAAVFVAAGPNVTALSAYTGAPIWTRVLPGETSLEGPPVLSTAASGGSTLYLGGASGRLYALNSITGADVTTGLAPLPPVTGPMALAGSTLYVPTASGLAAVDVTSGGLIWISPPACGSAVAVAGGSPYVATTGGQFVGFSQ